MTKLQLVSLFGLSIIAVMTLCQTATEAVYCSPSRDFDLEVRRHTEEMRAKREAVLEAARRHFEEKQHAERRRRVLEEEWEAEREATWRRIREELRRIQRETREKPAPVHVPEEPAPEHVPEKPAPEHVPEKPADPVTPEKIQTVSPAEGKCDEVMREDRRLWKPAAESPITLNTSRPIMTEHLAPNDTHVLLAFSQVLSEPFIQAQSCN